MLSALIRSAAGAGLSSAAMVLRDLFMANELGISSAVDAYIIVYTFVMFVAAVLAASMSAALTPAFMRQRAAAGENLALALAWHSGVRLCAGMVVVALVIVGASDLILSVVASNLSPDTRALARVALLWMAGLLPLHAIAVVLAVIANAHGAFVRPGLALAMPPLFASIALILAGPQGAVAALAIGTVLGTVVQLACFPFEWTQLLGRRSRERVATGALRHLLSQYLPVVAGAVLMSATPLIDQAMAATLAGGSIATLSYGQKLPALILMISALALSTAVLPHLSEMVANEDWVGMRDTVRVVRRLIVIVFVPLTVVLIAASRPLAALVFERGAFTAAAVTPVSLVQSALLLQVPFFLVGTLYVRLISALGRNSILLWGTVISLCVKVGCNLLLMRWLGVTGLALSTSIVYVVACIYLTLQARRAAAQRIAGTGLVEARSS
ncbi:MAG TPA: lipid II flippase MurJ [Steroidobacteraceae bacterium]|nr:lipid II flippase MurJ [Steroidobacteraceae bacterium]